MDEQRFSNSLPPIFRMDKQVFEINSRSAQPCGVAIEEKGEASGPSLPFGDYYAKFWILTETVTDNVFSSRDGCFRRAFIFRQTTNEFKDQVHIGACGRANGDHAAL